MKKLSLVLSIAALLTLAACGKKQEPPVAADQAIPGVPAEQTIPTTVPAAEQTTTTTNVVLPVEAPAQVPAQTPGK